MRITANDVKQLHLDTGAGYMDAKRALEKANGDAAKAIIALRKKGVAIAEKKKSREAKQGVIEMYNHNDGRVCVMLELRCETDFAAETERFKTLAHELALHVAAMNPLYVSVGDIPRDVLVRERAVYQAQARKEQKPEKILKAIVDGKLQKYYQTVCLMEQPYFRDSEQSVQDVVTACVAALRENVSVKRFARYELG